MKKEIINGMSKITFELVGSKLVMVKYYELMGGRYVMLGVPDIWNAEAVAEHYGVEF